MARLVLTILALVFITCVVADYDSHERGYRRRNSYRHRKNENHDVSGLDDEVSSEDTSNNSGAYSDSHERGYRRRHRYRHRKNDNRDVTGHDDEVVEVASEEISHNSNDTKAEPGTTEVRLPSGKTAYIKSHDDKMTETSQCGSKTISLELDPTDKEYMLMASEMQSTIRSHPSIQFSKYNITKIERVINGCLMKIYKMRREFIESQSKRLNERMLFYATPHTDDIVAKGFDERFANLNGMFGAGLYFTKLSSKSNQYALGLHMPCPEHKDMRCMICERKMIISRVTLGDIYKVKQATKLAHSPVGFHSVQGVPSPRGLKYDEYVIYRGDQAYPDYVVTYNLIP